VPGGDRGREEEQDDRNKEEVKGEIERESERDGEREERELKTAGPKLTGVFLGIRFKSFHTDLQDEWAIWMDFISFPCELCKQTLTLPMTHDLYKTIVTLPLARARTHTHELYCTTVATCKPDGIGMLPRSASSCFGCLYEQQIEILVCHFLGKQKLPLVISLEDDLLDRPQCLKVGLGISRTNAVSQ